MYFQDGDSRSERLNPEAGVFNQPIVSYKLQTGDVISIQLRKFVLGEEYFAITEFEGQKSQSGSTVTAGYTVDSAGYVHLPLLGSIYVEGKDLLTLNKEVTELAKTQFPSSIAEVRLINGYITVLGEVASPGQYPILKSYAYLPDILALSGDIEPYGNKRNVRIIRPQEGSTQVFVVDLTDISAIDSEILYLRNRDIVVITPLERKRFLNNNIQWIVGSFTSLVAITSLIVNITR